MVKYVDDLLPDVDEDGSHNFALFDLIELLKNDNDQQEGWCFNDDSYNILETFYGVIKRFSINSQINAALSPTELISLLEADKAIKNCIVRVKKIKIISNEDLASIQKTLDSLAFFIEQNRSALISAVKQREKEEFTEFSIYWKAYEGRDADLMREIIRSCESPAIVCVELHKDAEPLFQSESNAAQALMLLSKPATRKTTQFKRSSIMADLEVYDSHKKIKLR